MIARMIKRFLYWAEPGHPVIYWSVSILVWCAFMIPLCYVAEYKEKWFLPLASMEIVFIGIFWWRFCR